MDGQHRPTFPDGQGGCAQAGTPLYWRIVFTEVISVEQRWEIRLPIATITTRQPKK